MLAKLKQLKAKTLLKRGPAGEKLDYIVGLDIGTEFVKALIAKIEGDELRVIGMGREHQQLTDMQAGAVADITAVVKNCDNALSMAESEAGISVRTAVIGLAGELVKGTTTSVRCIRKDPQKQLDMAELEQIIGLVQRKAQERAVKKLISETGGKKIDLRLINSALVRIDIDGYQVTNPVGFQGKEMIVQLYTAFAPMIHIGALERIAQELDLDLLAVAAEPFAVSRSVVGDDSKTTLDAILMDVGGGTTDIAVIKEGGVQGTQMFGIGGRAYTRSIERDLGLSYARCEEMKLSLGTSKLPLNKQRDVEAALTKTLDVWIDGVELSLAEFSELDNLPNNILLCGGGSSLELLVNRLAKTNWHQDLPFAKRPVVKHIDPQEVVGIIDKTGKIKDHTFITAMGLLRVGLDTIQVQSGSNSGSMRQKIDRMLQV
jgi:cell division protein FtsA